jgi:alkanesulfonate monooxygenase SsuD/methylene tetrahydromethanopterin reductase-like flavin-dependent oxidoreductase (luciferase family)
MRFGFFTNLEYPGRAHPWPRILADLRDQARLCDEIGFRTFWVTEHHFSHEGYGLSPNPLLLSLEVARRTSRIRVGQAANLLPFWHPLRLAEDVALVDQLTEGRLEFGIGRGRVRREAFGMNMLADPANEEQSKGLLEETYEILIKAWTQEIVAHRGRFYQFPPADATWLHPVSLEDGRGLDGNTVTGLCVLPKPFQKPHPPVWRVMDSDQSIEWCAARGVRGLFWIPPVATLKLRFELYRQAARSAGRDVAPGQDLAVVRDCYVASSMEEAAEAADAVLGSYRWTTARNGPRSISLPGETLGPETPITYEFLQARNLLFGTPEHVAEKITELRRELGLQELIVWMQHGGLPQAKVMRSLELFGRDVLPHFADAPETPRAAQAGMAATAGPR